MSTLTNPSTTQNLQAKESLLAGDTVVYLLLTILVWGTWRISQLQWFRAGDDTGYWIGVAGGVMMLMLFAYPLRKRFRVVQGWGKLKWWFWMHMVLGVGGPLLILLHSTFRIGSLNAGVALYSMLIVAASGVVGRFIYARIHRGLRGEKTTLKELQAKAGLDQDEARSRLAFAPEVELLLKAFEARELKAPNNLFTYLRRVFWLPLAQWWTYRKCLSALQAPIRQLAHHSQWSVPELHAREGKCRRLIRRYLTAVTRVAQFTAYERLFSLWHVAHIPFVYLLILSAIVHVLAVHAY